MNEETEKKQKPELVLMAARSQNHVIGRENKLPWHLSSDLRFFKRYTMGKPILMGRKTWESLGKALPGRPNLVLTRNKDYKVHGALLCFSFDDLLKQAFALAKKKKVLSCVVIGGESLYHQSLSHADRIYLTEVEAEITGDAYFPAFDETGWYEKERKVFPKSDRDDYAFVIRNLERV